MQNWVDTFTFTRSKQEYYSSNNQKLIFHSIKYRLCLLNLDENHGGSGMFTLPEPNSYTDTDTDSFNKQKSYTGTDTDSDTNVK